MPHSPSLSTPAAATVPPPPEDRGNKKNLCPFSRPQLQHLQQVRRAPAAPPPPPSPPPSPPLSEICTGQKDEFPFAHYSVSKLFLNLLLASFQSCLTWL